MSTNVRVIESKDPAMDLLEQYKQYASVPDNSRDGILLKMLKSAMLSVQAFSDRAMLPCTLELKATDVLPGETIRLYQGGKKVLSVTDREGKDLEYAQDGGSIRVPYVRGSVTVVYENDVVLPEAEALLPVCWELATAIYDGEDTKAQGDILKKVYGML